MQYFREKHLKICSQSIHFQMVIIIKFDNEYNCKIRCYDLHIYSVIIWLIFKQSLLPKRNHLNLPCLIKITRGRFNIVQFLTFPKWGLCKHSNSVPLSPMVASVKWIGQVAAVPIHPACDLGRIHGKFDHA